MARKRQIDWDDFWEEFKRKEVSTVNEMSRSFGVEEPQLVSDSFMRNIKKWEEIIAESSLASVLEMEEIDDEKLAAAVREYTQLLKPNIYDNIDPLDL